MKKIFAVSVLLVLFLLLGSAYATEGNETQTLKLDNEEHISVPNDESTFSQLKNEISSGGDINLSHSSYKFDSGTTIEITNPGTIDGKGAVIDMVGSWDVCVFKVYCDGVIIKNMTFKNAHSTYYGSAIYFDSSGTVVDCNFINNTADAAGAVFFGFFFFRGFSFYEIKGKINKKKLFENIRLIFKNKKNSLDKIQTKQI